MDNHNALIPHFIEIIIKNKIFKNVTNSTVTTHVSQKHVIFKRATLFRNYTIHKKINLVRHFLYPHSFFVLSFNFYNNIYL